MQPDVRFIFAATSTLAVLGPIGQILDPAATLQ